MNSPLGNRPWGLPIAIAAIAAVVVAGVGGTMTDTTGWYESLRLPSWNPPPQAFGLIWTVVFTLIAASGVTAWRAAPDSRTSDTLIGLFAINGALNVSWTVLFFQLRRPDWAIVELAVLWLSIAVLIVACARHSRGAALLLLPYLAWVSVAGALNWQVIQLNGPF
ncbi:MAG: TspO/MBR family protein [Novosphingobium sp.]|uniref:TspO/MBR family protein n=1 Tax=Novosphingobium sp. TaxID=1874826 RepID=UPI0030186AF8